MKRRYLLWISLACLGGCRRLPSPRKYESTSFIQIHPSLLSDSEKMIAPPRLEKKMWEEASAKVGLSVAELQAGLSIEASDQPDLFAFRFIHDHGPTAKAAAEALSEVYRRHRNEAEKERVKTTLERLDADLKKQAEEVAEKRKKLNQLIKEYGIPTLDQSNDER